MTNLVDTPTVLAQADAHIQHHRVAEARKCYEQALRQTPGNSDVLLAYADLLSRQPQHDRSEMVIFQRAVQANPNNPQALAYYASALAGAGNYSESFPLYEQALTLGQPSFSLLLAYGKALVNAKQFEEASAIFQRALRLQPEDARAHFWYASLLENLGQYKEAINEFQKIPMDGLPPGFDSLLNLTLGRLYYRIRDRGIGNQFFERAIDQAANRDVERLKIVRNLVEMEPDSEEAIALLKQVFANADSAFTKSHARDLLASLLPMAEYFAMFTESPQDVRDMTLINRSIYHKIQNEISILKGIAQEILWDAPHGDADEFSRKIIADIETIADKIRARRNQEQKELEQIPAGDFNHLLDAIATTAHDIADTVNNEIAVIKGEALFYLDTSPGLHGTLQRLLEQIEFTEAALNDLKSVNEGIQLKHNTFRIAELFAKWQNNIHLKNAIINLDIANPDSLFYGDPRKLSGFLGELIENSLKYNEQKDNLEIYITSRDVEVCELFSLIRGNGAHPHGHYLQIIVSDNGRGIPDDKKQWIFLPATSTGGSSGLGLFLIRKTLRAMKGFILEKGRYGQGARFEICIPYANGYGRHGT